MELSFNYEVYEIDAPINPHHPRNPSIRQGCNSRIITGISGKVEKTKETLKNSKHLKGKHVNNL